MASFRSQTFAMLAPDGRLPQPSGDGRSVVVRPFIGTSGAADFQGVGTAMQTYSVPIKVAITDTATIPALQAFLKPANVASGTLVDDASDSWTGMVLTNVSGGQRLKRGYRLWTLDFMRAAP